MMYKKITLSIALITGVACCLYAQNATDISSSSQFHELVSQKTFAFNYISILRGLLGLVSLLFIAWVFSTDRKAISWQTVGKGLAIQFVIAVSVLFFGPVQDFFSFFGACFVDVLDWTKAGSEFLFGSLLNIQTFGFIFAFQILPTIIFFAALTSLLFYLGIIQKVVYVFAWLMTRAMKLSGSESLATVGNIFLGQTESPLMIKPYIAKMTKSEVMLIMTAGMATMAGGVLAAYMRMLGNGDPELELMFAKHLLSASVMAAPGAVVISKILVPQTQTINTDVEVPKEKIGKNILDAISNGTLEGLKLAANVGAMLLVFYALIAGVNSILGFVGRLAFSTLFLFLLGMLLGALSYLWAKNKNKLRYWLVLAALFIVSSTLYYLLLHDGAISQFLQQTHLSIIALGLPLSFGLLAGAATNRNFINKQQNKATNYLLACVGGLCVLSIFFLIQFSAYPHINDMIAQTMGGQYTQLSMELLLGYIFAPIVWLIGVCTQDVSLVGQLLGQKLILTEFVGYQELANMVVAQSFTEPKSIVIATYILCGFANFASIGIQIGGIGSLAPSQRALLSSLGMRALLGGTLSALISATLIGMMI